MKLVDAFAQCRTPADFYRVQITLENELTPQELLEQLKWRDELAPPARKWISALEEMMLRESGQIQPFRRTSLSENVQFCHAGAGHGVKSLLVGFCGNFQRLMMPLPVFLQQVPADIFDVLIFKDPGRDFFLRGVPGYVDSLAQLPERVERDLPLARYASVRCIGTSAGGAAALVAGEVFGAERALSFGGGHPARASESLEPKGLTGTELDLVFADAKRSCGRKLAFFGETNEFDRETAGSLCRAYPGTRIAPVRGVSTHNIFFELFERKELAVFISHSLLGGWEVPKEGMEPETVAGQSVPSRPAKRGKPSALFRLRRGWRRYGGRDQILFWLKQFITHPWKVLTKRQSVNVTEKD